MLIARLVDLLDADRAPSATNLGPFAVGGRRAFDNSCVVGTCAHGRC